MRGLVSHDDERSGIANAHECLFCNCRKLTVHCQLPCVAVSGEDWSSHGFTGTIYAMTDGCSSVTLVLGVGNVLKGDDAVGPYVVERLAEYSVETLKAIDCGMVPENYTSVVRRLRPGHLVIVDAADMGLPPGSVRIVPKSRAGALGLSTHSMPLSMFMDYVGELAGHVTLVGMQPERMRLGEEISDRVCAAADELADAIREGRLCEIPRLDEALLGDDQIR